MLYVRSGVAWTDFLRGWFCKVIRVLYITTGCDACDISLCCGISVAVCVKNNNYDWYGVHYTVYWAHKFGILLGYYTQYCEPRDVWNIFQRAAYKN